ncbi:DUF5996 family protein [Methyloceanibacter sp.]|uniref:DUF5996 family protein n=1 Tax=Methyloceanibacter sp. TaxID=1965321 RepID=UPI003D6D5DF4
MTKRRLAWPELPLSAWKETYATLHLWTQIAGKIRLVQTPWLNHSWHVVLYVSARGLTTSAIPYGDRSFQLDFDFLDHVLRASASDGGQKEVGLFPRSVADFHAEVIRALAELGIEVTINELPNEIPDAIRFSEDHVHAAYDREYAERFWRILVQSARVFGRFRTSFIGKCSPVHFFWGSFDLAVTRFSGRRAPPFPVSGGPPNLPEAVTLDAYSHEVSSAGFWPGGQGIDYPAFYSYASPAPPGFSAGPIRPPQGFWSNELSEFILPYDAVRTADDPEQALMDFLTSTYEAAAKAGLWDRAALEGPLGVPGVPRKV